MNIVLWTFQALLSLLYLSGGAYKIFQFEELARQLNELPHVVWRALGVIEVLGALLLVIPAATKWTPALTPWAATVLAVETFLLAAFYARHSLALTATNPLIWSLVMGFSVAFVAYGRFVLSPLG